MVAIGTESGSLHIVEDVLEKHKLHHLPKLHKKMIRTVNFTHGSTSVLTGGDDGEIKLVDLIKMKVNQNVKL
jgi:WD repeat-containing protein 61